MKTLVIIPTYNERENIAEMLAQLTKLAPQVDILVVDDSSPDGTGEVVSGWAQKGPKVHLLSREKKEGLGRAYLAGFAWGLKQGYELLVEMDADFSHRPEDLLKILSACQNTQYDFVVGSRYVDGGGTLNWSFGRRLLSRGGSWYARMILGYPLNDWTGGFNAWKRPTLQGMGLEQVKSEGYSFQIELKYRALRRGFKGAEVPILFEDRRVGSSKMSSAIVLEALYRVWTLRWSVS